MEMEALTGRLMRVDGRRKPTWEVIWDINARRPESVSDLREWRRRRFTSGSDQLSRVVSWWDGGSKVKPSHTREITRTTIVTCLCYWTASCCCCTPTAVLQQCLSRDDYDARSLLYSTSFPIRCNHLSLLPCGPPRVTMNHSISSRGVGLISLSADKRELPALFVFCEDMWWKSQNYLRIVLNFVNEFWIYGKLVTE